MSRLAQLLSRFQLRECNVADLRRAYFREAKKLHPDSNPGDRAAQEFAQLRADYDEALKLFEQRMAPKAAPPREDVGPEWGPNGRRWSASSWAARSQASRRRAYDEAFRAAPAPEPKPGVPVEGLPQDVVYALATFLTASLAMLGVWKFFTSDTAWLRARHRLGPEWLRGSDVDHVHSYVAPGKLRNALEGEAPSQAKAPHFAVTSNGSPLAAHRAAAAGKVWWLERCSAVPGCRGLLCSKDERGDTPLHFCAREGNSEACCALLRAGVSVWVPNHFGLAPEQLAQQLGHKEVVTLLRAWRSPAEAPHLASARRRVLRHPDGLGHLETPEATEDVLFAFEAGRCLQQAVSMAAGIHLELPSISASGPTELAVLDALPISLERIERPRAVEELRNCQGLLVHEPRAAVTLDAQSHWHALRRSQGRWWRLDPVRGAFALTDLEASELLLRYDAFALRPKRSDARTEPLRPRERTPLGVG
ncbi:unnamed protein product [Effrenium voratum]|nr:unnamed protein product [Effrenium voratum]